MLKELVSLIKEEPKWFAVLVLCGLIILYYFLFHQPYDPLPNRTVWAINSSWGKRIVFKTRIIQIPQQLFDRLSAEQPGYELFKGKDKHLILLGWDPSRCIFSDRTPKRAYYQKYFITEASSMFDKDSSVQGGYRKHFLQNDRGFACNDIYAVTPACWIEKYCAKGMCIINPQTHEAIVDSSQFLWQLRPMLKAYQEWTNEPLLKNTEP